MESRRVRRSSMRAGLRLVLALAVAVPSATLVVTVSVFSGFGSSGYALLGTIAAPIVVISVASIAFGHVVSSAFCDDLRRVHILSVLMQHRGPAALISDADLQQLRFEESVGIVASVAATVRRELSARQRNEELASTLAHDMRTPLAGLRMKLGMFVGEPAPHNATAFAAADLMAIDRVLTELDALVDALRGQPSIAQVKVDDGDGAIASAPYPAAAMVAATIDRITPSEAPRIDLNVLADFDIDADPRIVGRIFENLIGNSVKHGMGPYVVDVGRGYVRVSNGVDVTNGAWPRESDRGGVSHGLGLHIVDRLLKSIGGRMVTETESQSRFAVVVYFPAPAERS